MEKVVLINTYKGLNHVLKIIERVARVKNRYDVYRDMMAHITKVHNERPWGDVQSYAEKLGCYIYHGDKPATEPAIRLLEIRAKGRYMKNAVKYFFGEDLPLEDDRWYLLTAEGVVPLD